jgi:hypothetical protein
METRQKCWGLEPLLSGIMFFFNPETLLKRNVAFDILTYDLAWQAQKFIMRMAEEEDRSKAKKPLLKPPAPKIVPILAGPPECKHLANIMTTVRT